MSTNKTENLHLHSWEPTDPFKRDEFNDNFRWIDLAFGGLCTKLNDITVTEAVGGVELDMTGNLWGKYSFIFIRYIPANGCANADCVFQINDESNNAFCAPFPFGSTSGSSKPGLFRPTFDKPFQLLLFIGGSDEAYPTGIGHVNTELQYCKAEVKLKNIQQLSIGTYYVAGMQEGSKIEIWGVL